MFGDKIDDKLMKEMQMKRKMENRVFLASFHGVWLGGDALIVATTKQKALNKLRKELKERHLEQDVSMDDLIEVDLTSNKIQFIMIDNGDY